MWGGSKAEANTIAREVRKKLGLSICLTPSRRQLVKHMETQVIPLSTLKEAAPLAAALFLNEGRRVFSGITEFRGSEQTRAFNDIHVPGRQVSDISHELSHELLLHLLGAAIDNRGC